MLQCFRKGASQPPHFLAVATQQHNKALNIRNKGDLPFSTALVLAPTDVYTGGSRTERYVQIRARCLFLAVYRTAITCHGVLDACLSCYFSTSKIAWSLSLRKDAALQCRLSCRYKRRLLRSRCCAADTI